VAVVAAPERGSDANPPGQSGRGRNLNELLTILAPTIVSCAVSPRVRRAALETAVEGDWDMDFEPLFAKTPATIEEIRARVGYALDRHPLCRSVQFDIVSMPRTSRGGNWTISLQAVAPDALWEASDIVADIQDAYDLAAAA
jgi:hypothetical protein